MTASQLFHRIAICVGVLSLILVGECTAQGLSEAEMQAARLRAEDLSPSERERVLEMLGAQVEGMEAQPTDTLETPLTIPQFNDARPTRTLDGEIVSPPPAAEPETTDDTLPLLGRALFDLAPTGFEPASYGPVPGDYVIGPGDELVVQIWGEVTSRHVYNVDRRGAIVLRDAGQVSVLGMDLKTAQRELRRRLSRVYSGVKVDGGGSTEVDVSLGRLRSIRVFVIGEARRPGGYEVSSVSTLSQVLYAAGGPGEIGSMRDIQLIRDNSVVAHLDVYRYLLEGLREGDRVLREGDTIFIPVAKTIVSVTGPVRRSRRIELTDEEGLRHALRYAGGLQAGARTDIAVVRRIIPPADRVPGDIDRIDLDAPLAGYFDENAPLIEMEDEDIVSVLSVNPRAESFVSVTGSVVLPGRYGFESGMRVSDLLRKAKGPWRDALLSRALLVRVRDDYTRQSFAIDLAAVAMDSSADLSLSPMDSLIVYSRAILREELEVRILGQVRRPGSYEFYEGMTLRDLVLLAGGLTDSAEMSYAELSRVDPGQQAETERLATHVRVALTGPIGTAEADSFALENHDNVFIRMQPGWELQRNVTVRGEVLYPGVYTLLSREERLSSVIQRAGGLLPSAYPAGFRLLRIENNAGNVGLDLEKALGEPGSINDLILEAGDEISVPQAMMSVRITGEVGFPTSVVFEGGRSIGDYVERAGGYSSRADKNQTRVIYPNGLSAKVKRFWWDPGVERGSTIVVPTKDPREKIDWGTVIIGTTSVLASLATIYLVVITANNQ